MKESEKNQMLQKGFEAVLKERVRWKFSCKYYTGYELPLPMDHGKTIWYTDELEIEDESKIQVKVDSAGPNSVRLRLEKVPFNKEGEYREELAEESAIASFLLEDLEMKEEEITGVFSVCRPTEREWIKPPHFNLEVGKKVADFLDLTLEKEGDQPGNFIFTT